MQNTAVHARMTRQPKIQTAYVYPGMQDATPGFYYGTTPGVAPTAYVYPGCGKTQHSANTAYVYPGMN